MATAHDQKLDEAKIVDGLREITDDTTEAVVIITYSGSRVGYRSWGEPTKVRDALEVAWATEPYIFQGT